MVSPSQQKSNDRLLTAQNKYIRLCLNLAPRSHIALNHFRKRNWLPVSDRVEICTATTAFKYWRGIVPSYINDKSQPSLNMHNTRSQMELGIPLR